MSSNHYSSDRPRRPSFEPEIIPPAGDGDAGHAPTGVWMRIDDRDGVRRLYIARPGLPLVILVLAIAGLLAALLFAVLAGLVLLWIPFLLAVIGLAVLSGTVRYYWARLRAWAKGR
jgi:hypothetical protein